MTENRWRGLAVALAIAAAPALVFTLAQSASSAGGHGRTAESVTTSGSPTATSTSPSPSDTVLPTATPSPSPTPPPTPSPIPTEAPTETPSETAEPEPTESPAADVPTVEPASEDPLPAAVRAILTADASTMTGLSFERIVAYEIAGEEVPALRFTANSNRLVNMVVDVTEAGHTVRTTTNGTTVLSGDVVMDVTVFKADLLGVPVEFTPDDPPPLVLPIMQFTDVETHLVLVQANRMTVPGNNQALVN